MNAREIQLPLRSDPVPLPKVPVKRLAVDHAGQPLPDLMFGRHSVRVRPHGYLIPCAAQKSTPLFAPGAGHQRVRTTILSLKQIGRELRDRNSDMRRYRQRKPTRPRPLCPRAPLSFKRIQVIVEVDLDRVALGGYVALAHRGLV